MFPSRTWEVCSHSCRTHTVLQIKQLPLQPLPQQQLFSLKSRYTLLSVPHRTLSIDIWGMNGPTLTTKSHGKASLISLRDCNILLIASLSANCSRISLIKFHMPAKETGCAQCTKIRVLNIFQSLKRNHVTCQICSHISYPCIQSSSFVVYLH